jgi:cytochrome c oxidase subunit 1
MSAVLDHHDDHAHDHPHGWRRWLYATNHKDIGTMYLWFSFAMFLVGGCNALLLRAELFQPGLQLVNPEFFNSAHHDARPDHGVRRDHAGLRGFRELADPADDRRRRHGVCADEQLQLLAAAPGGHPAGAVLLRARRRSGSRLDAVPPLSVQMGIGMDLGIFASTSSGASSIMGSINIVTTILNMRAPGMTLMKMPLFVWTWLITAYLLIAVMPVLAGAITMLLTDRHFGTNFFNAAGGGDPVMYQHIFWFFGHPEVYIMILPAFGIVSRDHPDLLAQAACSATPRWSTRPPRSPSCRSSCGRTTCSPPACPSPASCSSCTRRC